jgi:hypothetical protein
LAATGAEGSARTAPKASSVHDIVAIGVVVDAAVRVAALEPRQLQEAQVDLVLTGRKVNDLIEGTPCDRLAAVHRSTRSRSADAAFSGVTDKPAEASITATRRVHPQDEVGSPAGAPRRARSHPRH